MKVLIVNSVCGIGSTGRICAELAQGLENAGHMVKIAYGRDAFVPEQYRRFAVRIGGALDVRLHGVKTRLLDAHGFGSVRATCRFLAWAEEYQPDLLWLHNIHGYYIHVGMLFDWIKKHPQMQVKWTLHDCWAFTGHCSHFQFVRCSKWQTGCHHCSQKKEYPASVLCDSSARNYERKRRAFTGVKNMTIITPSNWLAKLVKQSFLQEYPVEVVYNTIDTEVFKPTPGDFRSRYGLEGKKIVLGVASIWSARKGLDDFAQLANMLDDRFAVVLVGLSREQIARMPANIIALERTNSPKELAEIYTAADVFVNPTHEDNYPTVNLEAQACGTPVITYDTGGCAETIWRESSSIIASGDFAELLERCVTMEL